MDPSLPAELHRIIITTTINDLKVDQKHLDFLRKADTDFPGDREHCNLAQALFLMLDKIATFMKEGRIISASEALNNTLEKLGVRRQEAVVFDPIPPQQEQPTSTTPFLTDNFVNNNKELTAAWFKPQPSKVKREPLEESDAGPSASATAFVVTKAALPPSNKPTSVVIATPKFLTNGKCPFCPKVWPNGPTACTFGVHMGAEHRQIPGTVLRCSKCPSVRSRTTKTVNTHLEHSGCGGTVIFDYNPEEVSKGRMNGADYGRSSAKDDNAPSVAGCSFCDHVWKGGGSYSAYSLHVLGRHQDVPGTFFTCSTCPLKRTRSVHRMLEHIKKSVCGGKAMLEYHPESDLNRRRQFVPPECPAAEEEAEGSAAKIPRTSPESSERGSEERGPMENSLAFLMDRAAAAVVAAEQRLRTGYETPEQEAPL